MSHSTPPDVIRDFVRVDADLVKAAAEYQASILADVEAAAPAPAQQWCDQQSDWVVWTNAGIVLARWQKLAGRRIRRKSTRGIRRPEGGSVRRMSGERQSAVMLLPSPSYVSDEPHDGQQSWSGKSLASISKKP